MAKMKENERMARMTMFSHERSERVVELQERLNNAQSELNELMTRRPEALFSGGLKITLIRIGELRREIADLEELLGVSS